ncbi:MAG: hypothetical protein ACTSYQ_00455 [Candidatus Odinarchaeia archaeon]
MAEAKINDRDMIDIVVGDYGYGFSVAMLSEEDKKWLLSVLPRQMQEIHDRAVYKTRIEIQTGIKKLLGVTC